MKIAVIKESQPAEKRVAATPDSVKKYITLGAEVAIVQGAGADASIADDAYAAAGATVCTQAEALKNATIVLCVNAPDLSVLADVARGTSVVGLFNPYANQALVAAYATAGLQAFSLELLPRISRAQSMDVLSSQSNLAGYRAVVDAFAISGKVVPMMMTAAGTIAPAKVMILGAGVAGLQAIATAKRMGAVVSAFDVRAAAKEQVESLGAKFVEVPRDAEDTGETKGGYAKEMSDDYKRRQSEKIAEVARQQDMIITTALIPGKPAPVLIPVDVVEQMKNGAVIMDLAVTAGGNCPLAKPDEIIEHHGVKIVGYANMPARAAADASALYARNVYNYISALFVKDKNLDIQWDDELVQGTLLSKGGAIVHPQLLAAAATEANKE